MKKYIIIVLFSVITSAAGCADFELHFKKDARITIPRAILIGPFDVRYMNYDPYVSDEFKDILKLEFFSRGYNSKTVHKSGTVSADDPRWAVKICEEYSGDILVQGVISQRESGYLAEREMETIISFTVYDRNGAVIGEGYYHDNLSAGEDSLRRSAAERFVSELIKKLEENN